MMEWNAKALRNPNARITGVVYLLYFLAAILAQFLESRALVDSGNAVNLIAIVLYTALTLLFYGMFKPVRRNLSLIAAILSLAGCAVMALGYFPRIALPISPLLFFGPYCLLIGYLIFRSTFLPHILGVLMAFAGLGWLAFLIPAVERTLSMYIEVLGVVAEVSLMLWLMLIGVNTQRWREQANSTERSQSLITAI